MAVQPLMGPQFDSFKIALIKQKVHIYDIVCKEQEKMNWQVISPAKLLSFTLTADWRKCSFTQKIPVLNIHSPNHRLAVIGQQLSITVSMQINTVILARAPPLEKQPIMKEGNSCWRWYQLINKFFEGGIDCSCCIRCTQVKVSSACLIHFYRHDTCLHFHECYYITRKRLWKFYQNVYYLQACTYITQLKIRIALQDVAVLVSASVFIK